jgi:hypothetical protein
VPEAEFEAAVERDQPPTASGPGSRHSLQQKKLMTREENSGR